MLLLFRSAAQVVLDSTPDAFVTVTTPAAATNARSLQSAGSAFSTTAPDASVTAARVLSSTAVVFSTSSSDAGFSANRVLFSATGVFASAPADAALVVTEVLTSNAASYAATVADAAWTNDRGAPVVAASFESTFSDAAPARDLVLSAYATTYESEAANASLLRGRGLNSQAAVFATTSPGASLGVPQVLGIIPAAFIVSWAPAKLQIDSEVPLPTVVPGVTVVTYFDSSGRSVPALVEGTDGLEPPNLALFVGPGDYHLNNVPYGDQNAGGTWNYFGDGSTTLLPINDYDGTPPEPASGIQIVSRDGQAAIAEGPSAPYVWIRNVEYFNAGDKRWGGLNGDGTGDDSVAINACVAAARAGTKGRVVYLPQGEFRCESPIASAPTLGLTIVGEGKWASQLYFDPQGEDTRGLVIDSSQHVTLEGFAITARSANQVSYGLHFDYDDITYASYGHALRDIWINSPSAIEDGQAFEYGIVFSDAYGNNSEVDYWGVYVFHFEEAGLWLPGSQQKSHVLSGCQFNGRWDGVADSGVGGKKGIWAGGGIDGAGGSFQFTNGGMSSCSEAGFYVDVSNDPIDISNVQTENLFRLYGPNSNVATALRMPVSIRNVRADNINDYDPDGYIKLNNWGTYTLENIQVYGLGETPPKIRLGSSQPSMSASISRCTFTSPDSALSLPIINGSVYDHGDVIFEQNVFVINGESYTPCPVPLWLQHEWELPAGVSVFRGEYHRDGQLALLISADAFTADATTETKKIFEFPRGCRREFMYVYQYDGFTGDGLESCTLELGAQASGDEYLLAADLTETQAFRGGDPAELGTALTTGYAQGAYLPNADYFADSDLYATVTTTGMNIGDGEETAFTGGYFFVIMRLEVVQRSVTAV